MSLLDLSDLLSLLHTRSSFHLLVSLQRSANNVSDSTTLIVAKLLSLGEVAFLQSLLDVSNELGELTLTESGAESESALNAECDSGKQQSDNHRHNDTTFVDSTKHVSRLVSGVILLEVSGVTEHEHVETYCCDETENNNPDCGLDTLEALRFLRGCGFSLCSCHNLNFNFLVIKRV